MTKKILPKDIVKRWVQEVMTQRYDITIYPQECPFGEKFIRKLQKEGWDISMVDEYKIIVSSNDPLKLAQLTLRLRKQGYIVQD